MAIEKVYGIKVSNKDLNLFASENCKDIFSCEEISENSIIVKREQIYSIEGVKTLLRNTKYFTQLLSTLEKTSRLKVNVVGVRDVKLAINRTTFVDLCNHLKKEGKLSDIEGIDEKIDKLNYAVSFERLVNLQPQQLVELNGKKVLYDNTLIMNSFRELAKLTNKTQLASSRKNRELMYAVKKIIVQNKLGSMILLNENEKKCLVKIMHDEYVDTYAIDEINSTVDNIESVALNSDLIRYVFKNMPENYSKVEKAIYTYIKLCRMCTYDAEFYAEGQSEEVNEKHTNKERLSTISPSNNVVVCYEINQILAQLLKHVGINYEVKAELGEYGNGHSNLIFKANDFVIQADTVSTILGSDMLNTKMHSPIKGLICKNPNKDVQTRFNKVVKKVYDDIKANDPSPYVEGDTVDKWSELLTIFIEDPVDVTMKEKIELFTEVAATNKLPLTEKIAYLTKVYNQMFSKDKKTYMTIISQKRDGQRFKKPTLVITYNDVQKITAITHNKYVLFDEGEWKHIPRATLQDMFNKGRLSYISNHTIPGIKASTMEDTSNDQPT